MTSAENQLYRFNYCLALMLVTIFFELVFTEHWRRSFWLSFLIICRWNLFRTICANSRKVGLGKFLSPYKDIDLSRIPVDKGTNLRLRWKKYGDLYEIVHLSLILISLCLFTGVECGKGLLLKHVDSTVYNDYYIYMSDSFSLVIHFPNALLWTAYYNCQRLWVFGWFMW